MKIENIVKNSAKKVIERVKKWLTKISEESSKDYREQNKSINYEHLCEAARMKYFW